jgi:hypothetical protein
MQDNTTAATIFYRVSCAVPPSLFVSIHPSFVSSHTTHTTTTTTTTTTLQTYRFHKYKTQQ